MRGHCADPCFVVYNFQMIPYRTLILLVALLLPSAAPAAVKEAGTPEYYLSVFVDTSGARLTGTASLAVHAGGELVLRTEDLTINGVELNRRAVPFEIKDGMLRIKSPEEGMVSITYEGSFKGGPVSRDINAGVTPSVIGSEGVSLTGLWYPHPDFLCAYHLSAVLPKGYRAISEAETITSREEGGLTKVSFEFPHPADGISLVASNRYEITKESENGIDLYAYFFPEERALAKKYLEYTKKYIALYEKLIGKYPHKRFSVVENFLPTGYSMPTFTLLGSEVVRLPFIVETSLGHEILHQWLGNLVYSDYEKGNWAEGLTTYLADHYYEERKGTGWEYRKQALLDYGNYVNAKNEFPLKDFRSRFDNASKAIGYGKAALVFHMLRNLVGDEAFYAGVKEFVRDNRYRKASWDDIRKSFGKADRKDINSFFTQWVDTPGLPDLSFDDFSVRLNNGKVDVMFNDRQKGKVYSLNIPLAVYYPGGVVKRVLLAMNKADGKVTVPLDGMPVKIVIDEDYDVARTLSRKEIPPVISRLIGDEKLIMVVSESETDLYGSLISSLRQRGAFIKRAADIKDTDLMLSSIVVLGDAPELMGRLYGSSSFTPPRTGGFSIMVRENPWNSGKVIGLVSAKSKEEADAASGKIFHYGKYGALVFDKGRNVSKNIGESQRGLKVWKREQTAAIDTAAISTLADVIDKAAGKRIIYAGEYHDRFAHHAAQLDIIKGLYAKNKKLAVGMEMFQAPFQKVLDEYIAGTIDERTFLKRSQYFTRWRFDYNLYKPIIDFARAEKLPLVALNIRNEIVEKVSRKGLDFLTDEEKKEVPGQMDFSDSGYRERLREVFEKHAGFAEKTFDYFYQSQIIWDETMAQSIDTFFRQNPDYQENGRMVVIAGGGHLSYGTGIPKRAFRRNGYSYAIILNDADVEKDIADYILFPAPVEAAETPKLMVVLEDRLKRVVIKDFSENSVSEKAGLKTGDVVLSLDNVPVEGVDDARIHLLYKKKGDTVKVKILRKRFFFGEKEMEFNVVL